MNFWVTCPEFNQISNRFQKRDLDAMYVNHAIRKIMESDTIFATIQDLTKG